MVRQPLPPDAWTVYEQLFTIRAVEEHLLALFGEGKLSGTIHTCIGQEACAVGVVGALRRDLDIVVSNHRGHGHYLVHTGFDLTGLIGEVMGRDIGVCRGIGGSQQLHTPTYFSTGVQGSLIPSGVGMALAEKLDGSSAIVSVFVGDGTLGQGILYESMNIAARWKLPVLFVVEANEYAQTTPTDVQHSGRLAARAAPFDIPSTEHEVTDVFETRKLSRAIIEGVRAESRPHFLVLHTYRLGPHSKGDDHRDQAEIDHHRRRDPLTTLRARLQQVEPGRVADLESRIERQVRCTATEVLSSPPPDFAEALR